MNWNYEARLSLTARGDLCPHCDRLQMRPAIYAELRTLLTAGQFTAEQMETACEGYCLGHVNEWIPDFVIVEEM